MCRHDRRRAAAERALVERREVGVAHDQADAAQRRAQLVGHRLGEGRADVLAELDLPGVDGDRAVGGHVEPGSDLAGWRAGTAGPDARFLRPRGPGGEDDEPPAQQLHELAAIDLEPVSRSRAELVPLGREREASFGAPHAARGHPAPPFVASAARCTARTMRG